MFKRLLNKPLTSRRSFFLFGPRGTGKTTWLKHHLPDALFFILYGGATPLYMDGIKVLPIASALRNLSRTLGEV